MVATVRQPDLSANPKPSSRLEALARIASELELFPLTSEATAFAERAAQGRFYVACVGQFERGKSSLLNALLSEPILPTVVVPVRRAECERLEARRLAAATACQASTLATKRSLSSGMATNFSLLETPASRLPVCLAAAWTGSILGRLL